MTVNMQIDLVGPKKRGLVMGLNEAAGYGAVGLTALLTGYLAASYGLRPVPFYIGIFYTVAGLLISWLIIKDTKGHALLESSQVKKTTAGEAAHKPKVSWVLKETTWRNKTLFSVSQAGLVNNLNDGMSWGVFPLLFASAGVGLEGIGWIKAIYPLVWGLGMIVTGPLSDRTGRKPLIVRVYLYLGNRPPGDRFWRNLGCSCCWFADIRFRLSGPMENAGNPGKKFINHNRKER